MTRMFLALCLFLQRGILLFLQYFGCWLKAKGTPINTSTQQNVAFFGAEECGVNAGVFNPSYVSPYLRRQFSELDLPLASLTRGVVLLIPAPAAARSW